MYYVGGLFDTTDTGKDGGYVSEETAFRFYRKKLFDLSFSSLVFLRYAVESINYDTNLLNNSRLSPQVLFLFIRNIVKP